MALPIRWVLSDVELNPVPERGTTEHKKNVRGRMPLLRMLMIHFVLVIQVRVKAE